MEHAMFTWITQKDPTTHALVKRAVAICELDEGICFEDAGTVILTIIEIDGTEDLVVYVEFDTDPLNGRTVLEEAQQYVEPLRKKMREFYPLARSFFITIAEYDPDTRTYTHAMIEGIHAQLD